LWRSAQQTNERCLAAAAGVPLRAERTRAHAEQRNAPLQPGRKRMHAAAATRCAAVSVRRSCSQQRLRSLKRLGSVLVIIQTHTHAGKPQ
jgi:hypothetical protein